MPTEALTEGLTRRGARLVTGGTDNHLVLVDVHTSYGLTGRQAEAALLEAGVVVNRNLIPADFNGAWYTAGLRLGTAALTTLGLTEDDFDEIADIITTTLHATQPGATAAGTTSKAEYELSSSVAEACARRCADILDRHPLYPGITLTG